MVRAPSYTLCVLNEDLSIGLERRFVMSDMRLILQPTTAHSA